MPIISKETWDNLIPEDEKKKIRKEYEGLKECAVFHKDTECADKMSAYLQLFGKEQLQPQPLTYEDVARELFNDKMTIWFSSRGTILKNLGNKINCTDATNVTSEKQAEKLMALNKLMNVAVYLNQNWKPDWSDSEEKKFFPSLINNEIRIGYVMRDNSSPVYFRTEDLVKQAVAILGEDTVRLALTLDF